MVAELPHPRRVVTGHDDANKAVFVEDGEVPAVQISDTVNFAVLYETHEFPADNGEWKDPVKRRTESLANKDGVVLRVVDFKPNNRALFHRTESLDFGIITKGEIVCRLDDGVEKTFRAGDVCVQRGTIHSWENRTDETCRVTFVLIAAKTIDEKLETTGFAAEEMATGGEN
ncbi:cupin 2 domain-containing protein [Cordyceps fumosorosea ARSEF 2679]|uniref:Cupin 2 domain-containing protein n=1 Tax=Cordyceps fumosorosea (strain ARSEF 2679) TaxID=1081104 RepID=A0A167RKB6_CORFA|nr:cupin 2 domain-containing protein [Cordyceps fumosorosea ARSEF 2679]OAA58679.1 cupin 2 domain-containing protein [Cordyceps fumosorosea ARSEF 2679]